MNRFPPALVLSCFVVYDPNGLGHALLRGLERWRQNGPTVVAKQLGLNKNMLRGKKTRFPMVSHGFPILLPSKM